MRVKGTSRECLLGARPYQLHEDPDEKKDHEYGSQSSSLFYWGVGFVWVVVSMVYEIV